MTEVANRVTVFRPMKTDDLDTVMAIERGIYAHPWTRGNFSDSLDAGYYCWIAESGSEIVGYGVVMMVLDEAHLLNLSIASWWQRRGLGRQMLNFLTEHAVDHAAQCMYLEVRPSNVAGRALYAQAGFREIAMRPGYYPAGPGCEDAIVMEKLMP